MVLKVAWELGKTRDEILSLMPEEFASWVAFFKIQEEDAKKAASKNNRRTSGRGTARR